MLKDLGLPALSVSSIELREDQLEGRHIVMTCFLSFGDVTIQTHALIDCGATGFAFVDENFARQHMIPQTELKKPRTVEVIDGRPIASGSITHLAKAKLTIHEHQEVLPMFVTKLGHYPVVLGIPWLRLHDVAIRFASDLLTFGSQYCLAHCTERACTAKAMSHEPAPAPVPYNFPGGRTQRLEGVKETMEEAFPKPIRINAVGAGCFAWHAKKEKLKVLSLSLYEINKALNREAIKDLDLKEVVPEEYQDFLPLFDEVVARELPPHRPYDHTIPLQEGFVPPFGPIYSLNRVELEALRTWIEDNLDKGFIRSSSSPAGAPVLFAKKADGGLRLCVDYRGLNEGTIKNRNPLPLLHDTLLRLQKAKYYMKLGVRSAYNLIRVAEGEEWKTAFRA